jgi:hypothetical protein
MAGGRRAACSRCWALDVCRVALCGSTSGRCAALTATSTLQATAVHCCFAQHCHFERLHWVRGFIAGHKVSHKDSEGCWQGLALLRWLVYSRTGCVKCHQQQSCTLFLCSSSHFVCARVRSVLSVPPGSRPLCCCTVCGLSSAHTAWRSFRQSGYRRQGVSLQRLACPFCLWQHVHRPGAT